VDAAAVPEGASVGEVLEAELERGLDGMVVVALRRRVVERSARERSATRIVPMAASASASAAAEAGGGVDRATRPRAPSSTARLKAAGRAEEGPQVERTERTAARRAKLTTPLREPREQPVAQRSARRMTRAADRRDATGPPRRRRERLVPSTVHRNAVLAELRSEQLPVAEQLLRGGIPRLREAIEEQNARARAEGRPEVPAEPLLAMAEELLPRLNLATWKDRAVAARDAGDRLALRDLRAVVAAAGAVVLDEEGKALAQELKRRLAERQERIRREWAARVEAALEGGMVLEALRIAARPPSPLAQLHGEVATRLAAAAGAALAPDLDPGTWLELLEAAAASPVRRIVRPAGIPAEGGAELRQAALRLAGEIPALAPLLGLPAPPPPRGVGTKRPTAVSSTHRVLGSVTERT
jgi:hypothetical protein